LKSNFSDVKIGWVHGRRFRGWPAGRRDDEDMSEELRLDGRVALVTGAARGLGRAHALLLARRGARVVVNDIGDAAAVVREITEAGGEAVANGGDVSSPASAREMAELARQRWGSLDILVNNAGIGAGSLNDPEVTERVLGVHLTGTINLLRVALPLMKERGYGRIVNTSSGSVFGIPGTGDYAAGKGGILAYTRVLANELKAAPEFDIKINAIMPVAQTPIMPVVPDKEFAAMMDTVFAPAKVSPLVVLLAHEKCPCSGEVIVVGGGRAARMLMLTTAGYADDDPTPEDYLAHFGEVMAGAEPREAEGTLSDLLARRGQAARSTADLVAWARRGTAK
jgi:NAD(P)-dependent dehydrogenase (short-subunit alcohol dehydrogenase family)